MEKTGNNKKPRKYDESFKKELLKMVKAGWSFTNNGHRRKSAIQMALGRKWSRKAIGIVDKYKPNNAIRFSMNSFREQDWMSNIPLYGVNGF